MSEPIDDGEHGVKKASLVSAAVKGGIRAVSGARGAWRSDGAKRIRGGVKQLVEGFSGVTRFVKANTIRGLLKGEIVLREADLNRWFARVELPPGVTKMSFRCRPSRLVLLLEYERKLLGVRVVHSAVELPFSIERVDIRADQGVVQLRLDRDATQTESGVLSPVILRLLSRAALDLLESDEHLETLDLYSDLIERQGDLLTINVGEFPPFEELMSRELRLPGGHRLLPFRAIVIDEVTVREGQLIVDLQYQRDALVGAWESDDDRFLPGPPRPEEALGEGSEEARDVDDDETIEVTILEFRR